MVVAEAQTRTFAQIVRNFDSSFPLQASRLLKGRRDRPMFSKAKLSEICTLILAVAGDRIGFNRALSDGGRKR